MNEPSPENLQKMADQLGCSVDDLTGRAHQAELLALRARVAQLEAALKAATPYDKGLCHQLAFTNEQHLRGRGLERLPASMLSMIDAALKDAPQ